MLVLSRKPMERILIGDEIVITILKISDGNIVRIGVDAPKDIIVLRGELADWNDRHGGHNDER